MRIVLDAMGSDTCPEPEVQAAVEAVRQFGDEIILVGPEEQLKSALAGAGKRRQQVQAGGRPGHDHHGRQGAGAGAESQAQRLKDLHGGRHGPGERRPGRCLCHCRQHRRRHGNSLLPPGDARGRRTPGAVRALPGARAAPVSCWISARTRNASRNTWCSLP